jgi:hypothetical protein
MQLLLSCLAYDTDLQQLLDNFINICRSDFFGDIETLYQPLGDARNIVFTVT